MELRRELIERADFPQVRRGLDPEAVSNHLSEVAKAVEAIKKEDKGSAATTGEHVTAIVQAAETAASQLEQTARADAERMRSSAKAEADSRSDRRQERGREHSHERSQRGPQHAHQRPRRG